MGYMNFKDPVLEKVFKRFKWTRNNTILLFEAAKKQNILSFIPKGPSSFTFQSVLHQFQCIVTTTDAYYRRMINHENKNYGILIIQNTILSKNEVNDEIVGKQLKEQLMTLQMLLSKFLTKDTEKYIDEVMTISDHEHIHFGELIIMFRQAGIDIPDRIRKAWAL